MAIEDVDLDAAATAGIVTSDQAIALRAFVSERQRHRAALLSHEERFRFMNGFNDFFFAVGIVLFACGLGFFALLSPPMHLIAAAIIWALAELLVARMRLVLPGILLACFFVSFIILALVITTGVVGGFSYENQIFGYLNMLVGALAAAFFYLRFRLPFALLLFAGCLVFMIRSLAYLLWPDAAAPINSSILLCCGLLVFAAAMVFDISDRERVTRRADCAFWLHLLAAPLIVHSLVTLVSPNIYLMMTTPVAVTIMAIFAVLTLVAVVIDRRALLVSALIYIGIVIAYGIRAVGAGSDQSFVLSLTLLIVGSVVLVIGVGWQPLRRVLLPLLPASFRDRLPEAERPGSATPLESA